jgi:hypothetical protein
MAVYEIPLSPRPQSFSITFPNGVTYVLRLIYLFTPDDCWLLDISDAQGNPIVCGIPLVTGADLLAQYAYAGFGCKMFVTTDGDPMAVPRFFNLGITAHLYIEAP